MNLDLVGQAYTCSESARGERQGQGKGEALGWADWSTGDRWLLQCCPGAWQVVLILVWGRLMIVGLLFKYNLLVPFAYVTL